MTIWSKETFDAVKLFRTVEAISKQDIMEIDHEILKNVLADDFVGVIKVELGVTVRGQDLIFSIIDEFDFYVTKVSTMWGPTETNVWFKEIDRAVTLRPVNGRLPRSYKIPVQPSESFLKTYNNAAESSLNLDTDIDVYNLTSWDDEYHRWVYEKEGD